MNKLRSIVLACTFVFTSQLLPAQDKLSIKFGKIDPAAFNLPDSEYLKGADAVYIADIGVSEFSGNNKSWFTLEYKRHVRIKINNSNGFDAADFSIPMYFDGGTEERLVQVKGITYNLEGGKVVETALRNDQIFIDKKTQKLWYKKFTMPGVKVGSIIDVVYTINSDYMRYLRDWDFQGKYPRMWSEYEVMIPEVLNYVTLTRGYRRYDVDKTDQFARDFVFSNSARTANASSSGTRNWQVKTHRYVMKNVPALKSEPFTSTLDNHISKIEFQLSSISIPGETYEDIMGGWAKAVSNLNQNEYFGALLYKNNGWLDDEIKVMAGTTKDTLEKVHKIYNYIRDKYTCTDDRAMYLSQAGLKDIVKTKKGSVADMNLLLVAMLQHEGISAFPVILSTRANGYANELYPLMDRYNYTIAVAVIGDKEFYLDASDPMLGFGKLNTYCYNGQARVITADGIPVYLSADNISESKTTSLFMITGDDGTWGGAINSTLGYYESLGIREKIKDKGRAEVVKSIKAELTELELKEPEFDGLDNKEEPLKISYEFDMKNDGEDMIYFSPIIGEAYKENPFKSASRFYPVEMPYAMNEMYTANIEVPRGYTIDEVPKSMRAMLNGEDGMFEYMIQAQGDHIMLRTKLIINKANFVSEDYQTLRDFFEFVIKKQSEQIVFKKVAK